MTGHTLYTYMQKVTKLNKSKTPENTQKKEEVLVAVKNKKQAAYKQAKADYDNAIANCQNGSMPSGCLIQAAQNMIEPKI